MTTQHTPGPWAIQRQEGHPYIVADQGKSWKNPLVCSLYEDVTPLDSVTIGPWLEANENAEANARLIAAAPRMSDALKRAAHILAELPDQSPHLLALRTEIVACIKQATPEHYGVQS